MTVFEIHVNCIDQLLSSCFIIRNYLMQRSSNLFITLMSVILIL